MNDRELIQEDYEEFRADLDDDDWLDEFWTLRGWMAVPDRHDQDCARDAADHDEGGSA